MPLLSVNIDHVATLRNARGTTYPDPVTASALAELAGADGITTHLREDRRHITDRDVEILRRTVQTDFNLEMAATEEMVGIALKSQPDLVTLVPEKREEVTTEGGLNVMEQRDALKGVIRKLEDAGIPVSLFIDPDEDQISAAKEIETSFVEFHTGRYADAACPAEREKEFQTVAAAVEFARKQGLRTNGGHGLHYHNVKRIAEIPGLEGLYIGHGIVARSVFVGLEAAVREMARLVHLEGA